MANKIILSWTVSVAGSSRTPAQAAAMMAQASTPLYQNATTDPVLGAFFGLAVDSDVTVATATGATRTLTLNVTSALGAPYAPPVFPAHPNPSTPPVLPYPLTVAEDLEGSFLLTNGSATVSTTRSQLAVLVGGDVDTVQFSAQPGVDYLIFSVSAGSITLSTPYTGETNNSDAVQLVPAPVTLTAVYSSSPLDSATGSGAQTVSIGYLDSLGAAGTVVVTLDGAYPVPVTLAGGTIDIATITHMYVASVGGFGNSVGQITLSSLMDAVLDEDTQDEAQLKLDLALAYLPNSYFALTQPMASAPQLTGPDGETVDFLVTTGSTNVPTSSDMTSLLSATNVIQFAADEEVDTPFGAEPVLYEVLHVGPKMIILKTPYGGYDRQHRPQRPETGTKGTIGDSVINLATGATLVSPSPSAPPTNAQLASLLAQFVNPGVAVPPPNAPLPPQTMLPTPTLLSGFFTQTLQLGLAGVAVVPAAITFA